MSGLTPGTHYWCTVASNNSAPLGNDFAAAFDAAFTPPFDTMPVFPDPIETSSMACSYVFDTVVGGSGGGAPDASAPSLAVQVSWAIPRPNDAARSHYGPELYAFKGTLGSTNFTATSLSFNDASKSLTATAPALTAPSYVYNTPYTFEALPWNDGFFNPDPAAWASLGCTTPMFRPDAPTVSLAGAGVLDRSVTISWTPVGGSWPCLALPGPPGPAFLT